MKPVRSIAFVINPAKAGAVGLARELVAIARERGVRVRQTTRPRLPRAYLRGCDACCVIGGDGTLLGVVREAALAGVPLIGVNCGSLGFLTPFSPAEARSEFDELLGGGFRVDYRAMLECRVAGGRSCLALNDVLLKDEVASGLVHIEVFADGELVTDYFSDGLILATATGSTAYNLSAGGPIIHPGAHVIAMTPICPHTLSNRTIMFRDTVKLRVFNRSQGARLVVGIDGHGDLKVRPGESVDISMARLRLPLAQRPGYSHFAVLRSKLKWSGGVAERK
jgi:NAD+ kinase